MARAQTLKPRERRKEKGGTIYTNEAGPCRSDDIIPEESEVVQLAIKRLPPKESYDRVYRMRRAFQV